jgi:hypothetical protein
MEFLLVNLTVDLLKKIFYFLRYRDKEIRAVKEFEQRGNISTFFLKGFAIMFLALIALLMFVTIGKFVYDLIRGHLIQG